MINLVSQDQPIHSELEDDPTIGSLLPMFLTLLDERVKRIEVAVAANDFRDVRHVAHMICGSAANYGFPALACLARDLEAACKSEMCQLDAQNLEVQKADLEGQIEMVRELSNSLTTLRHRIKLSRGFEASQAPQQFF